MPRRKPYRPKVGDKIYFMLFNTPERKFYGGMRVGEIRFKNADGTYSVQDKIGYTYRSIKRKEIKGLFPKETT